MEARCYCIFEGGGARGIAHVGALAALQESNAELLGFAGTSAGAIVAALASAGYSSEELFGRSGSILDRLDLDPTNEWGFDAIKPVRTPPRLLGRPAWLGILASQLILSIGLAVAVLLLFLSSGVLHWLGYIGETLEFVIQLSLVLLLISFPFYLASPVAGLRPLAKSIDQALALKIARRRCAAGVPIGPDAVPIGADGITFGDMARAGCRPLKIVATDITRRRLALFSAETSPDVPVGDAVAASVCLPGIFRPWKVGANLHYDGGLVSNLPAWAFDAERALDRDAWTAVIEIADHPADRKRLWGLRVLASTFQTALFGATSLDTRGVDRLRSVALDVRLGLLEFAVGRERAQEVITDARNSCRAELVYQIVVLPPLIEAVCALIAKDSRTLINVARTSEASPDRRRQLTGQIRAALFFPLRGEAGTLLNEFSYGYEGHSDERVRLRTTSSLAGRAWLSKQPLYADRAELERWSREETAPEDRWSRKAMWAAAQWALYVPYFHAPNNVWLVVAVDCDEALALGRPATTLISLVDRIEAILAENLPQEAFAWL